MLSPLPLTPPLKPPSPYSSHLQLARTALYRTLSPPSPTGYFDYVQAVPNLELHSAAAEGNVGLVHYALTHGQPVNSVLHGVQAIHAAAAGGSIAAVKMLIDRGADVNAPRLPRRYSNEKKKGAPSLGAAGATPLHFAAANGHADIVQILLTCGAASNKSDKLGQTPASLAEANGHESVLHVLKVYDHLRRQDGLADTASIASGSIITGPFSEDGSPSQSTINLEDEDYHPSLKGKESAMSMASTRSDASGIIKLRKSLDGLLGRRSRKNSFRSASPDGLPYPPSLAPSSVYHSPIGGNSPASSHTELPSYPSDEQPSAIAPQPQSNGIDLARITSGGSQASGASGQSSTFASIRSGPHHTLPREHRTSHSSRRPSLPSILEKAAHPGQAFRNALHRREQNEQVRFNVSSGSSNGSQNLSGAQDKTRKYMSRNAFIGLFRRTNSPPSRSPSPPKRGESRPIDAQELEEGIERFRRASMELEQQERRSLDENRENPDILRQTPASAPPIKTRFFEDLSPSPPKIPNSAFVSPREGRTSPVSPTGERPWNRPRKGSNVIAPSPLANEWARESSDSDSTVPTGIRRTKTEGARGTVGPSRLSVSSGPAPGLLRATKQRSATLPSAPSAGVMSLTAGPATTRIASSSRLVDLALDERANLRAGVLRRESERKRDEVEHDDGAEDAEDEETEEEVFHDALVEVDDSEKVESLVPVVSEEAVEEDRVEPEMTPPLAPALRNRYRGASIGSMNSQLSRLSTTSLSMVRYGSNPSDDSTSDRHLRPRGSSDPNTTPPPPPPSSLSMDSRPRGKSVSSIATTASGSNLAWSSYHHSTSATSLTPPSTLSITLGSAFPPVPEDDVTDGSSVSLPPAPQRKFSSRAEAVKAIKQQEDDVLQLAQLPLNADSSRDLAAQLAAYGESHAMEQELAQMERREKKLSRRGTTEAGGKSKFEILSDTSSDKESGASGVSGSFVSAQSAPSSGMSSEARSSSVASSRCNAPPSMISVEAPKTSVPNISSIYDRRATLYREKMQALTAAPSLHAPSSRGSERRPRPRAATDNHSRSGPPAWLTGVQPSGSSIQSRAVSGPARSEISSSIPAGSLPVQPPGHGLMAGASAPKAPRSRKESFNSIRVPPPPAPPIADIVNTRYQGLPSVASYPRSTNTAFYSAPSRAGTNRQYSHGSPLASSSSQIQPAPAPAVSIFSHRYAGPHDGGESDDSEGEQKGYTMIENDWRGGKILAPGDLGAEGLARKGKWGFKGPFGKKK
ncbi:uncharacterized protein MKK02DRAFT_21286 [Dioszegia hungarica]|uniref:Ankyrin n=1 Tax=Dioszegia hungarica TaxID=4972 RepID=A0AA38H1E8_9TREE|nr:uncharacterized protein MKK02DRAFT_21286 [Dioszegia hungarica]KAI9631927.1 hypothetical protein MKK02DRAFT_21286 [Dioszegia hungarica]